MQWKGTTGNATLQVLNMRGQVVEQRRVNLSEAGTLDVNLTGKAKGLYLVRIITDQDVKVTKVIVQ
jgi:hypothetical protein